MNDQNGAVLFADVVAEVRRVAASSLRRDQVDALAELFARSEDDIRPVVAWAVGERQRERAVLEQANMAADLLGEDREEARLTVRDVDAMASTAVLLARRHDDDALDDLVAGLRSQVTSVEWEFLTAAVDDDAFSIDEGVTISAIAKCAHVRVGEIRRAAAICGSLAIAAETAVLGGAGALESVVLRAGRPVVPMSVASVADVDEAISGSDGIAVEWEIVGQRIQVHRSGGEVVVYDSDLVDVTSEHARTVAVVGDLPNGDLILDGVADGPAAYFFDLLFADGSLLHESYRDRRHRLVQLVPAVSLVPSVETHGAEHVLAALEAAGQQGRGGVIVKDCLSAYEPGHRSRAWRRVPVVHCYDAVVVAAEWGSARRAGLLSTVHLGARSGTGSFETVGMTSLGLTDELLAWQTDRFMELAVHPVSDERTGVVRVRPEQVVEVAASGVRRSNRYDSGYLLDEARIRRYRHDLDASDAVSVAEIASAADASGGPNPSLPSLPPHLQALPRPRGDHVSEPRGAPDGPDALTATWVSAKDHPRYAELNIDFDFATYVAPTLDRSRNPHRALLLARSATLLLVLALVAAAIAARWTAEATTFDGSTVETISRFAPAVAAALVLTGWWWTDQRTRNLLILDGRRPSRFRSITAWLAPVAGMAFLVFAIVPLEPTELLDLRPFIITVVFPLVLWRPYGLVRRIFATMIRLQFDALIAVAYLFDVVSFGLLWWWFSVWPSGSTTASPSEIDVLVGIGLAVCLTTALSLLVWILLLRVGDAAQSHREVSQRTRYEHRMLRLRGADPADPAVWWSLVQRRAEEQWELEESTTPAGETTAMVRSQGPTVDSLLDNVRRRNRVALRRLGSEDSGELLGRLRAQYANVTGEEITSGRGTTSERETEFVAAAPSGIERLRRQFVVDPAPHAGGSPIERLLDHAGAVQVEAAVAERNRRLAEGRREERMLPPMLYPIEAARLLTLAALVATTAAALWLLTALLRAGSSVVTTAAEEAADIDQARGFFIALASVAFSLIPLWTYAAAVYAGRCGVEGVVRRRHIALFVIAAGSCGAAFAVDGTDRGIISSIALVPIVACASTAGMSLVTPRVWFGLRSITVFVWAFTLPLVVAALFLGGLHRSTESVDDLQIMTFAGALAVVGTGLVLVLVALSTDDFQDELRLSPELQVPASSRRRRRR